MSKERLKFEDHQTQFFNSKELPSLREHPFPQEMYWWLLVNPLVYFIQFDVGFKF